MPYTLTFSPLERTTYVDFNSAETRLVSLADESNDLLADESNDVLAEEETVSLEVKTLRFDNVPLSYFLNFDSKEK